ncbi:MAG: hypothetical protein HONBIEJF_00436 [Fimbriimonadaceae bacterium]|nr:hypothetical protein [Fimbriimonadaceae bacterium]
MVALALKLFLATPVAPPLQELHHLRVKSKVGDVYCHQMNLEMSFAGYGRLKLTSFFRQELIAKTATSLTFRVGFLTADVSGHGEVFESARSSFQELSGLSFEERRGPTGRTISLQMGGIDVPDDDSTGVDMEFPPMPVPIGHEWKERMTSGPLAGEYRYRLLGIEAFDGVSAYRIESRLKANDNPVMSIESGPPNTWYISRATGIVLHAAGTHPVNFQGQPGYIAYRMEQVSGPR